MRKLYWYITTYFKKHGWVLGSSIIGALIIFSLFIPSIAQRIEQKPRRYVGLVGKYSLNNLPLSIQNQLSAGLTKIEDDDTVSPYLAERWTIEDGGKVYRFVIKKNIHWQDGEELKPEDIQYQFPEVETIATPNDIVFKLPDEFVPFPTTVAKPIFKTVQKKHLLFFKRPMLIGIGSYVIEDYQLNGKKLKQITLNGQKEKIIYRFYFTEDDAIWLSKEAK